LETKPSNQGLPIPPEFPPKRPCATLNPAKPFGKNLTRAMGEQKLLVVMLGGLLYVTDTVMMLLLVVMNDGE